MKKKSVVDPRPSWDEYFMEIAKVVAKRSNCSRRQVAAVIVQSNHLISTGYNGTPRGVKNCFAGGCPRCAGEVKSGENLDECLCVHAEQNAIVQAAKLGITLEGATLYCTHQPCSMCSRMIINSGITRVVYEKGYPDEFSLKLFSEAGIVIEKFQ